MEISLRDSLNSFIAQRVRSGGYANADSLVADLVGSEASVLDAVARGEPLQVDGHSERRLEELLDEAAASGDYIESDARRLRRNGTRGPDKGRPETAPVIAPSRNPTSPS